MKLVNLTSLQKKIHVSAYSMSLDITIEFFNIPVIRGQKFQLNYPGKHDSGLILAAENIHFVP